MAPKRRNRANDSQNPAGNEEPMEEPAAAATGAEGTSETSEQQPTPADTASPVEPPGPRLRRTTVLTSSMEWISCFLLLTIVLHASYYHIAVRLPPPLSAADAGDGGFSEERGMRTVQDLAGLGPHPLGSEALETAISYVRSQLAKVEVHPAVALDVDMHTVRGGSMQLSKGLFVGKTLSYGRLTNVVARLRPEGWREGQGGDTSSVLVSTHIDTVITTGGAGDCSSNVAVMLELVRALAAEPPVNLTHAIDFLFNTGEEEGLLGAHAYITQHPWAKTARVVIDLEAMGVGGRPSVFQAGPDPWLVERLAKVAPHPAALMIAQDLFLSGVIKSATDFQVYREVGGLSGLDFAYMDNGAVYHTKNDRIDLVRNGSLQHLGENMLVLLHLVSSSPDLSLRERTPTEESTPAPEMAVVFFDIWGTYLAVLPRKLMITLNWSLIGLIFANIFQLALVQSALTTAGATDPVPAALLSLLALPFTWLFAALAAGLPVLVLAFLPEVKAVPYLSYPWLAVGMFVAPAICGALIGHRFAYAILTRHLLFRRQTVEKKREAAVAERAARDEGKPGAKKQSPCVKIPASRLAAEAEAEAERWFFGVAIFQWLLVLVAGTYYSVGSSYLALVWVLVPSLAYYRYQGFNTGSNPEAAIKTMKQVKWATIFPAVAFPLTISFEAILRLPDVIIGSCVRLDRHPGGSPAWVPNAVVSALIVVFVCLTLMYLLPLAHRSGASTVLAWIAALVGIASVAAAVSGRVPAYTALVGRSINVVHVLEKTEGANGVGTRSYISVASNLPGSLDSEVAEMKDLEVTCGREPVPGEFHGNPDFITYEVKYGCVKEVGEEGTAELLQYQPSIVSVDNSGEEGEGAIRRSLSVRQRRSSVVSINTGSRSLRWTLALDTFRVKSFSLEALDEGSGSNYTIIPEAIQLSHVHHWHTVQFASALGGPRQFSLRLTWSPANRPHGSETSTVPQRPLVKFRTDVDLVTREAKKVLDRLPDWCVEFGKLSTPYNAAFLLALDPETDAPDLLEASA